MNNLSIKKSNLSFCEQVVEIGEKELSSYDIELLDPLSNEMKYGNLLEDSYSWWLDIGECWEENFKAILLDHSPLIG